MVNIQTSSKVLTAVDELYEEPSRRAKELRDTGKRVIGYFDGQTPVEILTAAGVIPYRIRGNAGEPVVQADAYLERIACSFVLNCFEMGLRGNFDFLDGVVIPHTCDHLGKIYNIWWYNFKPKFSYFVNVPHTTSPSSIKFFKAELNNFKKSLERFTGAEITDKSLVEAIKLHNKNRALVREIYALRKPDPPLLSAAEMTRILMVSMSLPVEESTRFLSRTIEDIKERGNGPEQTPARLLIHGPSMDHPTLFELIEGCGANVVVDDIEIGTRAHWPDVEIEGDPLHNLARRYLEKLMAPRTYRQRTGGRQEDLDNRFGHITSLAREFNVNGVILYIIRYCDNHEFDVPDLKEYLENAGLPVLHVEDEYAPVSPGRLKTQIEAFLETIS